MTLIGTCSLAAPSRRRRRPRQPSRPFLSDGDVVLLRFISPNEQDEKSATIDVDGKDAYEWNLCRYTDFLGDGAPNETQTNSDFVDDSGDATTLIFNRSIKIVCLKKEEAENSFPPAINTETWHAAELSKIQGALQDHGGDHRDSRKPVSLRIFHSDVVSQQQSAQTTALNSRTIMVSKVAENQMIASSVSFRVWCSGNNFSNARVSPDATFRTLLQSCLKRQLLASSPPLVYDPQKAVTTRIHNLPIGLGTESEGATCTLEVLSVVKEGSSSTSTPEWRPSNRAPPSSLFCILPHTRITLEWEIETSSTTSLSHLENPFSVPHKMDAATPTTPSPVASLLLETLWNMTQSHRGDIPRTFVLTGPPGVGKTHAVRTAVDLYNAQDTDHSCLLVPLFGSEILSVGQGAEAAKDLQREFVNAARATFRGASSQPSPLPSHRYTLNKQATVALIFLDECDALVSSEHATAMLAFLLDTITSVGEVNERGTNISNGCNWRNVMVVAATNRIDSLPAQLRRPGRFDRELPMGPPNSQERIAILKTLLERNLSKAEMSDMTDEELREIAETCVGYVAADLQLLVQKSAMQKLAYPSKPIVNALRDNMATVGASALRDAALSAPPKTSWEDVAGDPGGAKTELRRAIEWPRTRRQAYQRLGLVPPRGILLHGPPGCAKTSLARAAAGATGVAFLSLAPADVYASSYVGDAEAVVRRAFALARSAAPCILFFDEIDAIIGADDAPSPSSSPSNHGMNRRNNSAESRVLSTFLNEMDGVDVPGQSGDVLVLGATNRPWTLDAALLRPGRFDKIIYVPPPDREGRRSIMEMQCRNWKKQGADGSSSFNFDYLASDDISGDMTGAEIVGVCREVAMKALREMIDGRKGGGDSIPTISQESLEDVLRHTRPQLLNSNLTNEFRAFHQHRQLKS